MFFTHAEVNEFVIHADVNGISKRTREIFDRAGLDATDGLIVIADPGTLGHFYVVDLDEAELTGFTGVEAEGFIRDGEIFVY